jgi:hypothetical protein
MNKKLYVILAFLAIGYASCKDVAYKPPVPSPANSYFPETFGSTWNYRDSIYGEPTDTAQIYGISIDTATFTINGATTDFNGKVCYNANVLSKQNGPGTAYFYTNKHTVGLLESVAPFGFIDFEFFVDTASVGYSWVNTPTTNTLLNGNPVQSINTILEKNISKVVNGKTFTNVIHASVNFQVNINNKGFHNIAYYDFYLAQGVGLIEKDTYVYGCLNGTKTILSYTIK